ncbi:MAG: hypothetical protein ACR2PA_22230 [Hyphomicrobiaceae bacterium]
MTKLAETVAIALGVALLATEPVQSNEIVPRPPADSACSMSLDAVMRTCRRERSTSLAAQQACIDAIMFAIGYRNGIHYVRQDGLNFRCSSGRCPQLARAISNTDVCGRPTKRRLCVIQFMSRGEMALGEAYELDAANRPVCAQ